jgi:hypothetical protein
LEFGFPKVIVRGVAAARKAKDRRGKKVEVYIFS